MAIGVARMLGFRFKENFAIPYFSKSITEFWRRWHMSLSSWLRDYLYISFGGSRKGQFKTYRNLFLTMLIGGLWHGASWNFVVWGGLNGLFLSIEKLFKVNNFNPPSIIMKMIRAAYVFILINCTWVFFRATSFGQAMEILRRIFTQFNLHGFKILDINVFTTTMLSIFILFGLEYFVFRKNSFDGLFARKQGVLLLNGLNLFLILLVLLFGASNGAQFIYFQF